MTCQISPCLLIARLFSFMEARASAVPYPATLALAARPHLSIVGIHPIRGNRWRGPKPSSKPMIFLDPIDSVDLLLSSEMLFAFPSPPPERRARR